MNKIYVYHHNDHDGIVAAGILYNFIMDKELYKDEDIIFNMIDYEKKLDFDMIDFENGDKVYFLDYSFSNAYNKDKFIELIKRRKEYDDIVWIDHHVSSLDLWSKYDIPGIVNTALCGAAWTYIYCMNMRNDFIKCPNHTISKLFHTNHDIPVFLRFIDDYDCWKKLYPATNEFHYGLMISSPKDPLIYNLLYSADNIYKIAQDGDIVQNYLKFEEKVYHVDMYGFEFTLPEEHGGYRCFCLNRKGNSIMFGDKINEYDAVIPFYYINGKWKYSIFTNKDDVSCVDVAKSYGGGGHPKAAGWVMDELIFSNK